MDDEELFHRRMDSLGVDPIAREPRRGRPKPEDDKDDPAETVAEKPSGEEEDSLFLDTMSGLDVAPSVAGRAPRLPAPDEEPPEQAESQPFEPELDDELEDSLFLDSMDGPVVVPDKDYRDLKAKPRPQKVRLSKRRDLSIDEEIDLHGQTVEEALSHLRRFIASATIAHSRTVLVVTGKGHHSEAGRSVLRQAVEGWLRRDGASWVREYSAAPRALGGGGAFVVRLR